MNIPKIPENLDDWNIDILNELTKFVGIESETFDFKKESNELEEHICAMANTQGGILVLGVEQIKSKDGKKTIGFKKTGFSHGKEDLEKNKVTNGVLNLEPKPIVNIETIPEKDGKKFYMVIKIVNKNSDKPYFVTNTDQCFIRIHASKIRATRSIIFNLFSSSIEQRKNLETLKSACSLVKESFRHTLQDSQLAHPMSTMKISPLDLSFLRNSILTCEWFLREQNLWGEHTSQSSYTHGVTSLLHELDFFNVYINSYNLANDDEERRKLKGQLSSWSLGSSSEDSTIKMFDKIISVINEFLNNN